MTAPSTYPLGLDSAPTTHPGLLAWVSEVAELTTPDQIVWVEGSQTEWKRLSDELVDAGTLVRLNDELKPNSFWAKTDPTDVARVEQPHQPQQRQPAHHGTRRRPRHQPREEPLRLLIVGILIEGH